MKEAALGFGFSVLELAGGVIHDVYDKIANPPQLKQMLRKYQINQKRRRRRVFRHLRHEFGVDQRPPTASDDEDAEFFDTSSISLFGGSSSSSSTSTSSSAAPPSGQKIQKLEAELASLREAMAAFVSSGGATPLPASLLAGSTTTASGEEENADAPERSAPAPPPVPSMSMPPPPPPPGPAPDLAIVKTSALSKTDSTSGSGSESGSQQSLRLNSSAGSRVPIKRKRDTVSTGVSMNELMARSRSLRKVNRSPGGTPVKDRTRSQSIHPSNTAELIAIALQRKFHACRSPQAEQSGSEDWTPEKKTRESPAADKENQSNSNTSTPIRSAKSPLRTASSPLYPSPLRSRGRLSSSSISSLPVSPLSSSIAASIASLD
eukprot:CAMPEP_0177681824 /NCGR_PEP_ID=MMETSP0447-20121125/30929_1 /TAXON_ID=0 /ORGANISM="Stygamoeba regulata, Strain BSH-02190019" /LENGTH=376 /DNA_ID=CAMNT_0019191281 /DNA_START=157 /DNA_END=1287 /DNA_ORIENTATION=-